MATKRALTGGTGDVNPQWLTAQVEQTVVNTLVQIRVQLPIQRLPNKSSAQVIEILQVWLEHAPFFLNNTSTQRISEILVSTKAAVDSADFTVNAPQTIANSALSQNTSFTTSGQGAYVHNLVDRIDTTDGAGHGILVATDAITLAMQRTNDNVPSSAGLRIIYRFKNVPVQEYIGIVQSQQG